MTAQDSDHFRTGPVAALMNRWWIALAFVVVGGVSGALVGQAKAPQYTAQTRLIVGNQDLSSFQVAGFAQASQELASNYANYVDTSSVVTDRLQKAVGEGADGLVSIGATPISGSNVLTVQVAATSRATALIGVRSIASTLVDVTNTNNSASVAKLLREYNAVAGQVAAAVTVADRLTGEVAREKHPTRQLEDRLQSASTNLATLKLQQSAIGNQYSSAVTSTPADSRLHVITDASVVGDNSMKTLEVYAAAGAIVGLLFALALSVGLQRMADRKTRIVWHASSGDADASAP